ncbi:MAG: DMT family transporter [Candidatus Korobacteraceae bacterium]|jgi:drug/metabolite transporter (DMT)-like permease
MRATAASTPAQLRTAWYFLLLAFASLMWSAQGTAVKVLDRKMGPIAITFLPFYITTFLFVPLLISSRKNNRRAARPSARDWGRFVIAGVAGQVLAQLGMTWGISKSLASNGAILNLLIPVISAVLASSMLKERLTPLRVIALLIGLAGVFLMSTGDWTQASFGQMRFLTGNLLILAGCLGSSFYNVYCKGLMQRFTEIEILIFSYITASLASLPLLIWMEPFSFRTFLQFDWQSWAAFAFLAFFMYGASMLLFFKALEHLDVTTASTSLYLVPVFGVLLAAGLLGERMNLLSIAGAAVVLTATLLVMKYDASY